MNIEISKDTARKIAVATQLYYRENRVGKAEENACKAVEHLGYVQIDTLSVVERAHHHTLWTRVPSNTPVILDELLKTRRVFEYWGHAASYLPMKDYRFYLPKMKHFEDPHGKWEKDRLHKFGHLMPQALNRIKEEGPLGAGDFELPKGRKKGENWWDWHEMKSALELLYWTGKIMVSERRKFQKIYDLTERVLPQDVDATFPSNDEIGEFMVNSCLRAHGIASEKEISGHLKAANRKTVKKAIGRLQEADRITESHIEGISGSYYLFPRTLEAAAEIDIPAEIHILTPFDNLVIMRERVKTLLGFDYALECYVKPADRVHGYFVLPVIFGDKFICRMDCKAERKKRELLIKNLLFEPDVDFAEFIAPFTAKMKAFAEFNGCDRMIVEKVSPANLSDIMSKIST